MLLRHPEGHRITYHSLARASLSFRLWVYRPMTRVHARLLGPCFKTGRRDDQLLHRGPTRAPTRHRDPPEGQSHATYQRASLHSTPVRMHLAAKLRVVDDQTTTRLQVSTPKCCPLVTVRRAPPHASAHITRKCTSQPHAVPHQAPYPGSPTRPHAAD